MSCYICIWWFFAKTNVFFIQCSFSSRNVPATLYLVLFAEVWSVLRPFQWPEFTELFPWSQIAGRKKREKESLHTHTHTQHTHSLTSDGIRRSGSEYFSLKYLTYIRSVSVCVRACVRVCARGKITVACQECVRRRRSQLFPHTVFMNMCGRRHSYITYLGTPIIFIHFMFYSSDIHWLFHMRLCLFFYWQKTYITCNDTKSHFYSVYILSVSLICMIFLLLLHFYLFTSKRGFWFKPVLSQSK